MTLSKYTDNLYHSEVYRELERQAVKKGFFKPTDTELVKLAAQEVELTQQINQSIDTSPSDDLIQDVARLAYAMRRKGFVTQAEDLEQKLVIYKTAENALYDVTAETNADLIGFAHRDGDVNLIEGSGDLGAFETMQSMADKILAVTRKQPTGKQPMNRIAALAAMITKNAQEGDEVTSVPAEFAQQSSDPINVQVGRAFTRILGGIAKKPVSADSFRLDDAVIARNPESFVALAGLSGQKSDIASVNMWFKVKTVANQNGLLSFAQHNIPYVDDNKVYEALTHGWTGRNMAAVNALANALAINFQGTYMSPSNQSQYIFAGGMEVGLNEANARAAAKALADKARAVYTAAFGAGNESINASQKYVSDFVNKIYTDSDSVNPNKDFQTLSFNESMLLLNNCVAILKKVQRDLETQPRFDFLSRLFSQPIAKLIEYVIGNYNEASGQYSKISQSSQLSQYAGNPDVLTPVVKYFVDTHEEAKQKFVSNLQEFLKGKLKAPWGMVAAELKKKFGLDVPDQIALEKEMQKLVNSITSPAEKKV
ncbi:hypothetical protein M0R72_02200 [Candidatus Pacearchaeota archaeon]|jgi:ribosomal protein S3AE|nr:hypothetical protein [Candidatus Pacearchaeota archaeon]